MMLLGICGNLQQLFIVTNTYIAHSNSLLHYCITRKCELLCH